METRFFPESYDGGVVLFMQKKSWVISSASISMPSIRTFNRRPKLTLDLIAHPYLV